MNQCEFQRGFFTLHNCERLAVANCESCGRAACQQHLTAQSSARLCADCAEKQNQTAATNDYGDDWVYSYRSRYYTGGYRPFSYNQHDYNSFDNQTDGIADDEDDSSATDFSDS